MREKKKRITFRLIFNIMLLLSLLLAIVYPQSKEKELRCSIELSYADVYLLDLKHVVIERPEPQRVCGRLYPEATYENAAIGTYRIKLTVLLRGDDDFTWDKPLKVNCLLPGFGVHTVIINKDGKPIDSRMDNYAVFTIRAFQNEYAKITLSRCSESETDVDEKVEVSQESLALLGVASKRYKAHLPFCRTLVLYLAR